MADGDTQAKHLLQLELDGRLDFRNLGSEIFIMRDWGRELAGFVVSVTDGLERQE